MKYFFINEYINYFSKNLYNNYYEIRVAQW